MTTRREGDWSLNRRGFLTGAAAAGAIAVLGARAPVIANLADDAGAPAAPAGKPNSVINGVHIGCITYSYRGNINTAEDTLKALVKDGLSETELMDGPIRAYAGITGGGGAGRGGAGAQGQAQPAAQPLTDAQRAQQREAQLAKCRELRKMYND